VHARRLKSKTERTLKIWHQFYSPFFQRPTRDRTRVGSGHFNWMLSRSYQDAYDEDEHAAHDDLKWRRKERGVHVAMSDPGNHRQFHRYDGHGHRHGGIKHPTIRPTNRRGGRRGLGVVNWVHPAYANRHIFTRNDEEIVGASMEKP
jgi:hypothetical protein